MSASEYISKDSLKISRRIASNAGEQLVNVSGRGRVQQNIPNKANVNSVGLSYVRPLRILDAFCCAGGASMGYYHSCLDQGIPVEITGIDIHAQPNYPFTFVQGDAVAYIKENGHLFDFIHCSPPCQFYSKSTSTRGNRDRHNYLDLYAPVQDALSLYKIPSVIENVPGSPVRPDLLLRGDLFGLKVIRLRVFELINFFLMQPPLYPVVGTVRDGDYITVCGKASYRMDKKSVYRPKFDQGNVIDTWKYAMGIGWPIKDVEISQAIPPAYTRYIGNNLFKNLMPCK